MKNSFTDCWYEYDKKWENSQRKILAETNVEFTWTSKHVHVLHVQHAYDLLAINGASTVYTVHEYMYEWYSTWCIVLLSKSFVKILKIEITADELMWSLIPALIRNLLTCFIVQKFDVAKHFLLSAFWKSISFAYTPQNYSMHQDYPPIPRIKLLQNSS